MINPHLLEVWKQKFVNRARGTKIYRAGFDMLGYSKMSRKTFRTASDALMYGGQVKVRWCRLYDAAILEMSKAAI
jgi:hypothetical protein